MFYEFSKASTFQNLAEGPKFTLQKNLNQTTKYSEEKTFRLRLEDDIL